MPSSPGGSYSSLASNNEIYRPTTVASCQNSGFLDGFKKALQFVSGGSAPAVVSRRDDFLVEEPAARSTVISRTDSVNTNTNKKMPSSGTIAEEAALLGTMPSDSMDDIELKNIQLHFPASRTLSRIAETMQEEMVETDRGTVMVATQGYRNKPAIVTYHDLGLNYLSSFQAFFNYIDMRALIENFCVYHINAPGQEEGAQTLPEDYIYPTMDELASQVSYVLTHFGIKQFIGFGVGAGANILARYALIYPERVSALCLINCTSTTAGWIEWGYQKLNARHLRSKGMTQGVLDYLMWHHFGRNTEERNHDLVHVYKTYFERNVNPTNLSLFMDSYVRRTDLNIHRDVDPSKNKESTLRMPVMNITGSLSPHADDTVTFNGRLDPSNSSWMKISDSGMVLEEQPAKVSEAFRLFLQGEGYGNHVELAYNLETLQSAMSNCQLRCQIEN
ncbi:protein NDRG3 isoform X2 [Harmonia axyridis]|uniref:protein NDRG3 isoform X2 n=1 Tax=Harmonia axyridis TaxID=115357 RepID=UPI001E279009|nr:protein NDRG3 isoform X2 [Harmonia axyridis]XP_045464885.1 protein NDRG3 isoform X2 [Harmonia axyridis]XP_045464886.1 protein NDRG3 isoform X2 [Harmonia axyridis]